MHQLTHKEKKRLIGYCLTLMSFTTFPVSLVACSFDFLTAVIVICLYYLSYIWVFFLGLLAGGKDYSNTYHRILYALTSMILVATYILHLILVGGPPKGDSYTANIMYQMFFLVALPEITFIAGSELRRLLGKWLAKYETR